MQRFFKSIFFAIFLITFIIGCSDDDEGTNPTTSTPESVGTYEGNNSMDKPMLIVISNIDGKAWVTQYSIEFEATVQNGTADGTKAATMSDGIVEVVDNKFVIDIGDEAEEILTGEISGNEITGGFYISETFPIAGPGVAAGTYTVTKK